MTQQKEHKESIFMRATLPTVDKRKERARIVRTMLKRLHPKAKMILKYRTNWELLVAVILSAQCTDKQVNQVTRTLFRAYPTLDSYLQADQEQFEQVIFSTGFYRAKAKNILAAARVIQETFHGRMPKSIEDMLRIPGVGRKTANVVLGNAYGIVEGIAVDTHVKRLAKKFGLTTQDNPDKIEKDLMLLIPKHEWFLFTYRMIDYGRAHSPARLKSGTDPISVKLTGYFDFF